jgi:hypothetical protein
MMGRWSLMAFTLLSHLAHSQVKAGTVVIFDQTETKFIVAADSRATFPLEAKRPPDDAQCKIVAFKNNAVFSSSGFEALPFSINGATVDNVSLATGVIKAIPVSGSVETDIQNIADKWGEIVANNWNTIHMKNPKVVADMAQSQNGLITSGVFAKADKTRIAFAVREIRFLASSATPVQSVLFSCGSRHPCVIGKTVTVFEFSGLTSARAKTEHARWSTKEVAEAARLHADVRTVRFIRFAELTAANDSSVGGAD